MEETQSDRIPDQVITRAAVVQGSPPDEIVKCAGVEKADNIVMASHGWTGWRKMVFGSVADKVVRMAECPVLMVSEPKKK